MTTHNSSNAGNGLFVQANNMLTGADINPHADIRKAMNVLSSVNPEDSDGDGIPDHWERFYGLNPYDPTDAGGDWDGDGVTNLEEFRRGKNPLKSDSRQPEVGQVAETMTQRVVQPVHPEPCEKTSFDAPTDG